MQRGPGKSRPNARSGPKSGQKGECTMQWKTREGKMIEISDMKDGRLLNAHRMIREQHIRHLNALAMFFDPVWGPQSEMAAAEAEKEMLAEDEKDLYRQLFIAAFDDEIQKRGLSQLQARVVIEDPPKVAAAGKGGGNA